MMLARKEEVRVLVEEDEDGMIHSLLSSLPALIDEHEPLSISKDASASSTLVEFSLDLPHLQNDGTSIRPSSPPLSTLVDSTDTSIDTTIVADPELDSIHSLAAEEMKGEVNGLGRPKQSPVLLPDEPPNNSNSSPVKAEVSVNVNGEATPIKSSQEAIVITRRGSYETPSRPITPTKAILNGFPNNESLSSHAQTSPSTTVSTMRPVPPTSTESPTLSLSSLLAHASHLQTLFPPSHPSLHLSEIMGPQSVVHTWSENFSDWPSDDEAEKMVSRIDLVVYSSGPDAESDDDSEDQSEIDEETCQEIRRGKGESQARTQKRKRNKLTKSKLWNWHHRRQFPEKPDHHRYKHNLGAGIATFASRLLGHRVEKKVEKRTILAGAVVVLGVAVAMYGVKSGRSGSAAGSGLGE